jgi:hypothetical protein|tara:strand:+ start:268 stop:696 length:429 start_codon:yes stop_codon:yes gene_type:complete
MGLKWDISGIKDSDNICWEYIPADEMPDLEEGWEPVEGGLFQRMNPKTMGIIMASTTLHINNISQSNLLEWIYRLDSLFDAGKSFIAVETDEGEIPIRIRIEDLKDHIGLKTSASNWPKTKFDAHVREVRMMRHLSSLSDID